MRFFNSHLSSEYVQLLALFYLSRKCYSLALISIKSSHSKALTHLCSTAPIITPLSLKFFEISKHQDFISASLLTELTNNIYSITKWTCKCSQKLYIILWSQTLYSEIYINIQIPHICSFIVFMYIDIKKYTF